MISMSLLFRIMKRKRSLKMNLESYYIPKENISNPKGEDAHFIHKADYQTIGVADGVGGWTQRGVVRGNMHGNSWRIVSSPLIVKIKGL